MQYFINLVLTDSEAIAIRDAINRYIEFTENEIKDEIKAPYWARLQSIKKVEEKLNKLENGLL